MNPLNQIHFDDLTNAVEWSDRQMIFPRKKRVESVKQFVGYHYFENGTPFRLPVPMISLAVMIYARQLAAKSPRVMVGTRNKDLLPTAADLELALNQIPDEIDMDTVLRRGVIEALFSFNVWKCGLYETGNFMGQKYGEPFIDVISADDYTPDMAARKREELSYECDTYWMDYNDLMDGNWSEKGGLRGIKADEYTPLGENGERKAEGISQDQSSPVLYRKKKQLRDVWLPKEKLLLTYLVKEKRLVNVIEWAKDLKNGPYHWLAYNEVPGNLLPLPNVALWRDLHELGNDIFRKLGEGAKNQKSVLGFQGGNDDSVLAFQAAKDGEGINYQGAKGERLDAGGIDPRTLAFFMQTRDLFSYFAGNLDSLGGLAPITSTIGQDKLIGEAAGAQLRDMADKTVKAVKGLFESLAYYEWTDPIRTRTLEKKAPNSDISINVDWSDESKKGSLKDYDFNIDVYSLQEDSPQIKLQKLKLFVDSFIVPMMPMIQQASGTVDVEKIITTAAKFSGLQENQELVIWTDAENPNAALPPNAESVPKPANTTRTYDRVSSSGRTTQGDSAMMQQLLMGGNPGGNSQGMVG